MGVSIYKCSQVEGKAGVVRRSPGEVEKWKKERRK
jgi:hypothetical protein